MNNWIITLIVVVASALWGYYWCYLYERKLIVHCKDCKHYMDNNICPLSWECFDGNDFCSHGERRNDGDI